MTDLSFRIRALEVLAVMAATRRVDCARRVLKGSEEPSLLLGALRVLASTKSRDLLPLVSTTPVRGELRVFHLMWTKAMLGDEESLTEVLSKTLKDLRRRPALDDSGLRVPGVLALVESWRFNYKPLEPREIERILADLHDLALLHDPLVVPVVIEGLRHYEVEIAVESALLLDRLFGGGTSPSAVWSLDWLDEYEAASKWWTEVSHRTFWDERENVFKVR
jgi:integrase